MPELKRLPKFNADAAEEYFCSEMEFWKKEANRIFTEDNADKKGRSIYNPVYSADYQKVFGRYLQAKETCDYFGRFDLCAVPTNEPLTLEQLREMDGQPVFLIVEDINGFEPLTMWALVETDNDENGIWLTNSLGGRSFYEDGLEDGITAFRYPPKEDGTDD